MTFAFATSGRICFGNGLIRELPERIPAVFGAAPRLVVVVTGAHPERHQDVLDSCSELGCPILIQQVSGEPSIHRLEEMVDAVRSRGNASVVVGLGGGSVLDAGKALSALLTNPGSPLNYLEVIGQGRPLVHPPVPYIAVPTTAGTGAEVTKNAVLKSDEHGVKVSLRSDAMLPRLALIDPELTLSVPPAVTASTGLDALTQVIEPFVSRLRSPLTDGFCREGMVRGARSLQRAYRNGSDAKARNDMALTSLFGGLALANAKLGAVHGFAGPLGGMFESPHGAVCARLLPIVMATNVRALNEREGDPQVVERYLEVSRILTGDPEATLEAGVTWVENVCDELCVPGLGHYGMRPRDIDSVVQKSRRSSSMKGNPIELTTVELSSILEQAL